MQQVQNISWQNIIRRRGATVLGVFIALALVIAAVAIYFGGASATAPNSTQARVQGWVNQLSSEELTPSRHLAQQHLEEMGDASVDPLLAALHSSNATLRRNSAEMLGFIASPRALDGLTATLNNDSAAAVRSRAAWALGELNSVRAVSTLERASVLDRNLQVRQAAAGSITALRAHLALTAGKNERLVSAFAIAPSQLDTVYLSEVNTISVSRDGGKTWNALPNTVPSRVSALAVSPTDPNVIYVGTESVGLYKTTDGGVTWTAMNDGLGVDPGVRLSVTAIAIEPQNADRVYVATGAWIGTSQMHLLPRGVMSSADGGKTWQAASLPNTSDPVERLVISDSNLYVSTSDRVLSLAL